MDLNSLKPPAADKKRRKRVGRGSSSGQGKTSGRGQKGQRSRSGYKRKFGFEGGQMPLHRRLPKRGFHHEVRKPLAEVNLDVLDKAYNGGDSVTVNDLLGRGLTKNLGGGVKVLGRGEVTKKLYLTVHAVSASARAKIEAAGGAVTLLTPAPSRASKGRVKQGAGREG